LKPSTGLVIGKFMPPHAGHLQLIAYAQSQVDQLFVVLFTKQAEPIPAALRLAWLRELLPGVTIYHIDREFKVDFDDPEAWAFWVRAIRDVLPAGPDLVLSSEAYGDELARRLGARHVLVDPARCAVPVSATQIRQDPLAHWEAIPPPVRPYYVRRMAIIGAECTGKTTLARALAEHFQTVWVPEVARAYLLARGGACTPDDLLIIAREQAGQEEALARKANRLLICDTDLMTTRLWHERYFGPCPPEIQRLAGERRAHLYLLSAPDVPWVADGLRDSPHYRQWFHERFQGELSARGLPHSVLTGSLQQRLAAAISHVAPLLNAHESV